MISLTLAPKKIEKWSFSLKMLTYCVFAFLTFAINSHVSSVFASQVPLSRNFTACLLVKSQFPQWLHPHLAGYGQRPNRQALDGPCDRGSTRRAQVHGVMGYPEMDGLQRIIVENPKKTWMIFGVPF